MIADEMGLTKAAVYYHFPAKVDIRHEIMLARVEQLKTLIDEAAAIRGRRARVEHLVNGFVDFFVANRQYALTSTDPAAKREKLDEEPLSMRRRALALIFGDNPTATERLAFTAVSSSLSTCRNWPTCPTRNCARRCGRRCCTSSGSRPDLNAGCGDRFAGPGYLGRPEAAQVPLVRADDRPA